MKPPYFEFFKPEPGKTYNITILPMEENMSKNVKTKYKIIKPISMKTVAKHNPCADEMTLFIKFAMEELRKGWDEPVKDINWCISRKEWRSNWTEYFVDNKFIEEEIPKFKYNGNYSYFAKKGLTLAILKHKSGEGWCWYTLNNTKDNSYNAPVHKQVKFAFEAMIKNGYEIIEDKNFFIEWTTGPDNYRIIDPVEFE